MPEAKLKPVCNRCDVALVQEHRFGETRISCPVCGSDFGNRSEVMARMHDKLHQPFRDRRGWRAELAGVGEATLADL